MNTPPRLSVVLPCYNEAGNLSVIFARFRDLLGKRTDVEVVFVNNGSTDDSAATMAREAAKAEHAFARVVTVPVNHGYGYGIMAGVRSAQGDIIAWTHADLQTDPADVLAGFERLRTAPHVEQTFLRGRRQGRNVLDVFFTAGMSAVASLALGVRLQDINAQPKMFHRSFLNHMSDPPDDFSLDLYALYTARTHGFTILEQPVRFGRRRSGEAKGGGTLRGKLRLIQRTWKYIFELKKRLRTGA